MSEPTPDPNRENDQTMAERVTADAVQFWAHLGIELVEAAQGRAVVRIAMRPELGTRRHDVMHGGAIATLIDAASGSAVATLREPDDDTWRGHATTDLNVSYLRAVRGEAVAEGKVLRAGRTTVFVNIEVRDGEGEVVAVGRATYAISRRG